MGYDGHATVQQLFSGLARGFAPSGVDIILTCLGLVVLVAAMALAYAAQRRSARGARARRLAKALEQYRVNLRLTAAESSLLWRLAMHLNPGESLRELVTSRRVFDACARLLSRGTTRFEAGLDALRLKLGFQLTRRDEVPASSSEIPRGSHVSLCLEPGQRIGGAIVAQGPDAMVVAREPGGPRLVRGMSVTLRYRNAAGVFTLPTRVREVMRDAVRLTQTSRIQRSQRRRYFRRRLSLEVQIQPAANGSGPLASHALELGGGGGSFENPGKVLGRGDQFLVSFSGALAPVSVVARVLRVSTDGEVVHARFEQLAPSERDRIMRFLVAHATSGREPA